MKFHLPTSEEMEQIKLIQEAKEKLYRETCCFTGHRPDKLQNCYSLKHPESIKISEKLYPILEQLVNEEGIRRFISGGAIGFDQIAFWTVHKLKKQYPDLNIHNIVAVPFKNQACKWTDAETQTWYKKMLEVADEVVFVDHIKKYGMESVEVGEYHIAKMQKRNEYMVDRSRIVVACWDGTKGGTGNCVNYATKHHTTLYQMNPKYDYELCVRYGMYH